VSAERSALPAIERTSAESTKSEAPALGFLPSLALMRAIAALLVVYDHLVGSWLEQNRLTWRPARLIEEWVFGPMRVMMHGGGFAVALFFLVSGFVIVYVAQRETVRQFTTRRVLRIFPPLWVSMAVLAAVSWLVQTRSTEAGLQGYASQPILDHPSWRHLLAAMTLTNYLFDTPQINGVAWTLLIEVLFYTFIALLLPLVQRRPVVALCAAFACLVLLQVESRRSSFVFLLNVNGVYVTFLFLGSLVYFRWAKRIDRFTFVVGTLAFAWLFFRGVKDPVAQPPYEPAGYAVSYGLAWVVFVTLVLFDSRLRPGRISMFFSRISYSLYLNHGGLGLIFITFLYPRVGYPGALYITFPVVVALSAMSFRWVEQPSQRLARRLSKQPRALVH
jgi:peptidoglycan/LPS O-acetylase OafA/YrhL